MVKAKGCKGGGLRSEVKAPDGGASFWRLFWWIVVLLGVNFGLFWGSEPVGRSGRAWTGSVQVEEPGPLAPAPAGPGSEEGMAHLHRSRAGRATSTRRFFFFITLEPRERELSDTQVYEP